MAEKTLIVPQMITVGELADKLGLPVTSVIGELFKNGIATTVNQRIDFETAQIIIEELGLDVELERKTADEVAAPVESQRHLSEDAVTRPPIVAVMGHVDHGKTTLLDAILDTKVVSGEAGGITQHISAYQTVRGERVITLLDTPGHEAFGALRQHGAALTDVVIIVVAADDGVKPQTVEAIKFAQSAHAKIVVAINKMDKETADPNRVKSQLAEMGLNPEEWGGDTVMVEVSAKTHQNLDKLLDIVLLVADIEDLRAESNGDAEGIVIEARTETGRGPVVGVLVEHGELRTGSYLVAGGTYAKVRTQLDYAGRPIAVAGPATPVTITGFKTTPQFGDRFTVVANEKIARQQAETFRQGVARDAVQTHVTSGDMLRMMTRERDNQSLPIVLRADVQGSLTSVLDSVRLLETSEITPQIVSSGIGNISENDVRLAAGAGAVVYGFNVQLPPAVKRLASRDKVEVRLYRVIYELLDDVRADMESLLAPEVVETNIGELKVLAVFRTTRDAVVAGGDVLRGKVVPNVLARITRGDETVAEAEVLKVQRQQIEAREVFEGDQCGVELKTTSKLTLQAGDRIHLFTRELVKRKLS